MTILTKSAPEKVPEKLLAEPLFSQEGLPPPPPYNPEYANPPPHEHIAHVRVYDPRRRVRAWHLFAATLMVVLSGILAGAYLYREYSYTRTHRFKTWCGVPLMDSGYLIPPGEPERWRSIPGRNNIGRTGLEREESAPVLSHRSGETDPAEDILNSMMSDIERTMKSRAFFQEEFDLDTEDEQVARIEVPDFTRGRPGRFVHDFGRNFTGIVDLQGRRCFVMPLNRTMVMQPHDLFDLVLKMKRGIFDVDTSIVRQRMRVVSPQVKDVMEEFGPYIGSECQRWPTYRLEAMTRPVFRRSLETKAETKEKTFLEFAGKKFSQIEIVNLDAFPTPNQHH